MYAFVAEAGDPYFGTDFGFDFGPWFVRFRYGFGPWFVRLRSVVRTVSVRFRSVVRTVSVRGSYGFGPLFVRFRSVVLTVSVRGSYGFGPWFLRFRYGFVPWFVRLGTVSFRGSYGSVRVRSVVRKISVRSRSVTTKHEFHHYAGLLSNTLAQAG